MTVHIRYVTPEGQQRVPDDTTGTGGQYDAVDPQTLRRSAFPTSPHVGDDGTLDNITGILYKTRALTELAKGQNESKLKDIAYPPLFVPSGKTADDLMKQFQQEKRHMAVVVNEFGGVMGIVTLEDLLEEVVGEIMDETDITEELIKRLGKNHILVHSRTEVRKVNDFLKVDLGDEAVTIGGLIQQELGRIPKVGEEVRIANCRILIHEAEPRSIRSVQIFREEKSPAHVEAPNLDLVS